MAGIIAVMHDYESSRARVTGTRERQPLPPEAEIARGLAHTRTGGVDLLARQAEHSWHASESDVLATPFEIVEFDETTDGLTTQDYENFALLKGYEIAASSRRSYLYQWGRWEKWAVHRRVKAIPANPVHVKAYLIERLLTHGHKPATLRAAAAAISYIHRESGEADPCDDDEVRATLAAAGRRAKWKQKQADALTEEVFWKIIPLACRPRVGRGGNLERPETALRRGRVDIAMIALMRDCLLRVSEVTNAVWSHIEPDPDGSGTLWLPESKTDQEGEGEVGYISSITMTFLDAIRAGAPPDASIFGIRPNQISLRIKRAAIEAGLDGKFSGHSPRVGMARDLGMVNTSLPRMMRAGRWKSPTMPARYIRMERAKRNAVAEYYNRTEAGRRDL